MYKTIEIDGKEMEFAANAATPFRYKQTFKADLFSVLANEKRVTEEGAEVIMRLAYIMNNQAKKADMGKLNEDDFISTCKDTDAAILNYEKSIITIKK